MRRLEYALNFKLSDKAQEFITQSLERSFSVKEITISDSKISAQFAEAVEEEKFHDLIKRLLYIAKSIHCDVLFENKTDRPYNLNPQKYLEARRDVVKVGEGMFLFQGNFLKIFHQLNNYVRRLADKYNAVEQEYPTLWPVDLYKKINYFKEFPHQVILCTSVKPDFASRSRFGERYAKNQNYDAVEIDDTMATSHFGLESAVCDCCYYALQDQTNFPNTVLTCYNKVFRNETSKIDSLDRLINFSVRDIMFVGEENFVLTIRQHLIDEVIEFVKWLDLDCKIETASDPFFSNDSAMKNVFQYASRLKYEILARLNFSGTYLAVGSINLHLDFFSRAFNIRIPDGSHAFSGCIGIGFERLVYALYCQYGHDEKIWPKSLQEKLGIV